MARKMSPNQKAYAREVSRIKGQITRLKNLGYVINEAEILPTTPSRITKAQLKKIKNIRGNEIYKGAYYQSYRTGELVSYADIRNFFREAGLALNSPASAYDKRYLSELPAEDTLQYATFDIIERLKSMVENLPNEKWYYYGKNIEMVGVKGWALNLLSGQIKRPTLDFILENWERISNAVEIIQFASKQATITTAVYQFTDLLVDAFNAANVEVANVTDEDIEPILDYYDNWQDY